MSFCLPVAAALSRWPRLARQGGEQVFEQGGLDKRVFGEQVFDKNKATFLTSIFQLFLTEYELF